MSIVSVYGLSGIVLQISPVYLLACSVSLEWGVHLCGVFVFHASMGHYPFFSPLLLFLQSSPGFWGVIPGVFQGSLPACRNCRPCAISWVSLTFCSRTSLLDCLYFFLISVLHGGNLSHTRLSLASSQAGSVLLRSSFPPSREWLINS